MRKVFVTGATGFVGSYICRLLVKNDFEVYVLTRPQSQLSLLEDIKDDIKIEQFNMFDNAALESVLLDVDIVVHCAAELSIKTSSTKSMFETNVDLTTQLVNACLLSQVKKFIFISSIAALSKKEQNHLLDENSSFDKNYSSLYGLSKHLAEREVRRAQAEGLDVVILNPSLVVGAGFWDHGTPSIIRKTYKGLPFYSAGSNGLVDVRDIAQAVLKSINYNGDYDQFIVSAENWTIKDFFNRVGQYF